MDKFARNATLHFNGLCNAKEAYVKSRVGNKTKQVEVNAKIDTGALRNLRPLTGPETQYSSRTTQWPTDNTPCLQTAARRWTYSELLASKQRPNKGMPWQAEPMTSCAAVSRSTCLHTGLKYKTVGTRCHCASHKRAEIVPGEISLRECPTQEQTVPQTCLERVH